MTCLNPGRCRNLMPGPKGPVAIPGIVLFWGAAIPGDIPHIGTVGTQPGAEPQTLRTERLEGAQRERIWASTEAHESGLSVRQIASATGLNSSRDPTPGLRRGPRDSPGGNCQQHRPNRPDEPRQEAAPSQGLPDLLTRWQSSSRCREWLERLDCGELVAVNLRPETDPPPKRLSAREERAALWAALGPPPHERR